MTKADLVHEISLSTGIEKPEVKRVIESMMERVKANVQKGENVYLRGFGSFERVNRAAKVARHIFAGTSISLPSQNVPKFFPAKEFKEQVK